MAKMMSKLVLQKSLRVTGVRRCRHISHVTPDLVWISDVDNNLVLTNNVGDDLHHLTDIASAQYGIHTVNKDKCLIYIDSTGNILKLSTDNTTKSILIKYAEPWRPRCIYSSPSTGDLLVGMVNTDNQGEGKVVLYNSTGEQIHTIQHDNSGGRIYSEPKYITENQNGDIIVSDWLLNAVVVTEHGGRHRFSYTGPPEESHDLNKVGPSESKMWPLAICTDELSHIIICDPFNTRIHLIDKNGHFLLFILTKERTNIGELFMKGGLKTEEVYIPQSLGYDEKTNLLWVGLANSNMVEIYKYTAKEYRTEVADSTDDTMHVSPSPQNC
ncbi:uncharacterized protein LOC134228592 [Saccostrea cucullata]|uniref:uncharacterized protein LOC134228592 n=1 Tax=Saccostrea cuccullata TaxID=36930 RepID=UPI002ED39A97